MPHCRGICEELSSREEVPDAFHTDVRLTINSLDATSSQGTRFIDSPCLNQAPNLGDALLGQLMVRIATTLGQVANGVDTAIPPRASYDRNLIRFLSPTF